MPVEARPCSMKRRRPTLYLAGRRIAREVHAGGDVEAAVLAVLEMHRKLGEVDVGAGHHDGLHRRFLAADLDDLRLAAQSPQDLGQQLLRRRRRRLWRSASGSRARCRPADSRRGRPPRTARPSDWLRAHRQSRRAWWCPIGARARFQRALRQSCATGRCRSRCERLSCSRPGPAPWVSLPRLRNAWRYTSMSGRYGVATTCAVYLAQRLVQGALSDLRPSRCTISGKSLCGMNAEAFARHKCLASTSGDRPRREPPQ